MCVDDMATHYGLILKPPKKRDKMQITTKINRYTES